MTGKSSLHSNPRDRSYVIWRTPGAGFFSIITSTLARLHVAEQQGLTPVIDFETPPSVYQETDPVGGTRNVWEYYFLQPAGRGLSEIGENPVTNDGTWPKGYGYDLSGSPIYKEMWDRYVTLNEQTRHAIEQSQSELDLSRKTLAVHYRGQEMRTAKGHHYPPTIGQMNAAISWALDNNDVDDILLVTEAQQYVDAFSRRWGKRIKPSPSFRLRHRNSYTISPPPRSLHKYLLGLEALRDAHLMAACGGLVCGRSNLSEAAIMLSDNRLAPLIRISQGRNSFRPYVAPFKWYVKRAVPPRLGGFPSWSPPVEAR